MFRNGIIEEIRVKAARRKILDIQIELNRQVMVARWKIGGWTYQNWPAWISNAKLHRVKVFEEGSVFDEGSDKRV